MHDDHTWLLKAIELSRRCPPTQRAYCVGAILVSAQGAQLSDGYSRENDPLVHAEESALAKAAATGVDPTGATMYTSLEPCSARKSRPRSCTELIIAAGIHRVVFALHEPPLFAECHGVELLQEAGLEVVELQDLGRLVEEINHEVLRAHLK